MAYWGTGALIVVFVAAASLLALDGRSLEAVQVALFGFFAPGTALMALFVVLVPDGFRFRPAASGNQTPMP
jgi:hypothetical protein